MPHKDTTFNALIRARVLVHGQEAVRAGLRPFCTNPKSRELCDLPWEEVAAYTGKVSHQKPPAELPESRDDQEPRP
ncbi:hypothetical protein VTI74DRAFT_4292 [Chaetomium olivicolor]